MANPEDILAYWLDEVGPDGWYRGGEDLDQEIRDRFEKAWIDAQEGACGLWLTYASGSLAYLILADQFSRNMFRGTGQAFASDRAARAVAKAAIKKGWDMKIDEPARQFFYMPLMHSENLCDQDRCVRLMKERMPETGKENLLHARAHREIIRMFGRFPYRNEALRRETTEAEARFMESGGYGQILRTMKEKLAA
ncbi:MAG TPA: DUF924 domain-containing protein [Rhodobacteraceae bacterium]|nr:DUF924 domain-containing protein [Paracoccaceae bacterium]